MVPLKLLDGTADFCQEYLDDVVIPAEYVIGEVNDGWRVATTLMINERTAVGRGWSLGGRRGESEDRGIELDSRSARPGPRSRARPVILTSAVLIGETLGADRRAGADGASGSSAAMRIG